MSKLRLKALLGAGCFSLALMGAAHAGGLERGGYNIDLLFDPAPVAGEFSGTYVMPDRKIKNAVDTDTTTGFPVPTGHGGGDLNSRSSSTDESESYFVPRIGIKVGVGDHVDCMGDYSQPWGAHTNPGLNWAGANSNIETKIDSENFAGTCSYKIDVGKGQFRFIGGVFYQDVSGFKERLVQDFSGFPVPLTGIGRIDLDGNGVGWRIGAAYEIPEIALRASLVYNSAVDLGDVTGTVDLTQVNGSLVPVVGTASMPQSVEFKVQSGIAPDWLAFGSVKWVDWSVLQIVNFCAVGAQGPCTYGNLGGGNGFVTSLDLLYRDGWTVSGGIGHKFNDQWSGAATLTWDRGTTTGLSTQTDTWTVGAGASFSPNKNVEVRFGGAIGILTSGSAGVVLDKDGIPHGTDVSYDFGNDLVTALSTSLKVKW